MCVNEWVDWSMGGQVCDGWMVDGYVYMDGLCMDVWVEALVYR